MCSHRATMLLYGLIVLACLQALANGEGKKSYEGWSLVKAYPTSEDQVKFLTGLADAETGVKLQVWKEGNVERPFDLFMSPNAKAALLTKLDQLGVRHNTTLQNAQRAINSEKKPISLRSRTLSKLRNSAWFSRYLRNDEFNTALQQLASAYPSLVQVQSIGKSHEKRDILVARVSGNSRPKPEIWLDGGIHAREWASPSTVLFILNKLVTTYNTDPVIRNLVDGATWYIAPVVNPDGYEFTHTGDRMWRKNRRPGKCAGVDLNRNFDFGFGGAGTSSDKCSEIYRGTAAFSEPESRAVRDFILGHKNIQAYLTLHTYSQMWFYPYGHKRNNYPGNVQELKSLAIKGASALASVHQTRYSVGTAANLMYEAAGGSDDWAKGKANIRYVYCLELRPDDNSSNGFILPPREIVAAAEETWAGLKVVADAVVSKPKDNGYSADTGSLNSGTFGEELMIWTG